MYSAHRNARPWHGVSETGAAPVPDYAPECYLCPGNPRSGGAVNPHYDGIFIFDNDHPVVSEKAPHRLPPTGHPDLYLRRPASGIARVVCYDPRHNVTLSDIAPKKVARVFLAWREQMQEFIRNPGIRFVLIFENKGEMTGTSSSHPHCQIYATNFTFKNIEQELRAAADYRREQNRNLFADIIAAEQEDARRIVAENEHAVAFVPFFARYAYEAWIFPKKRHATLASMADEELHGLAAVFRELTRRYDLLFRMSFPYVMAVHQAPVHGGNYSDYHLHLVLLPPLRQPGIRKFLAGPEIGGGNFMADTMPEDKAAELRAIEVTAWPNHSLEAGV